MCLVSNAFRLNPISHLKVILILLSTVSSYVRITILISSKHFLKYLICNTFPPMTIRRNLF